MTLEATEANAMEAAQKIMATTGARRGHPR